MIGINVTKKLGKGKEGALKSLSMIFSSFLHARAF